MPIGWPRTAQLVEQGNNDRLRLLRLIREGTALRVPVIKVGGAADVIAMHGAVHGVALRLGDGQRGGGQGLHGGNALLAEVGAKQVDEFPLQAHAPQIGFALLAQVQARADGYAGLADGFAAVGGIAVAVEVFPPARDVGDAMPLFHAGQKGADEIGEDGHVLRSSLEKRNMLIRYGQAGEGLGKAERGLGRD